MNIKKWKQFSDVVDKKNKKIVDGYVAIFNRWIKESNKKIEEWESKEPNDRFSFFGTSLQYRLWLESYPKTGEPPICPSLLEKTEVNFYEWQAGKLKLK